MQFANNALLPMLYGEGDKNLLKIEKSFGVVASSRGNMLALTGDAHAVQMSRDILQGLYNRLESGGELSSSQVDAAIRMASPKANGNGKHGRQPVSSSVSIKTLKKTIQPYSPMQAEYIDAL